MQEEKIIIQRKHSLSTDQLLHIFLFRALDYIAILVAEKLALILRMATPYLTVKPYSVSEHQYYFLIPLIFIFLYQATGVYGKFIPMNTIIYRIIKGSFFGIVLVDLIFFMGHSGETVSRLFIALIAMLIPMCVTISHKLQQLLLKKYPAMTVPCLLIGQGRINKEILANPKKYFFYNIIGYIADRNKPDSITTSIPYLGTLEEAEAIIKARKVDAVIINMRTLVHKEANSILNRVYLYVRDVVYIPDIKENALTVSKSENWIGEKAVLLFFNNNLASPFNRLIKRLLDLVLSFLGMGIVLLVVGIIAIAIKLDSKGPVFFGHMRVGRNGKLFKCYKFRTMIENSQEYLEKYLEENPDAKKEWEANFKLENDPRITKVGAFLRKTSLDELPQLWNVLKGEMSLVGPRPITKTEVAYYEDFIEDFYLVRPGITGIWQVSGRSDTTYEERVRLDSWYVRNWSVWLDITCLYKTISVVLKREGAY